jgi:hypothetical protein
MNNAYQNQFNNAYAQPYVPVYTPRYYAPVRTYSSNRYLRSLDYSTYDMNRWAAEQDQLREMRKMNRTLQLMEWDLQDAARLRTRRGARRQNFSCNSLAPIRPISLKSEPSAFSPPTAPQHSQPLGGR